jgi:D-glucuronyl C5-epimerase-like protein
MRRRTRIFVLACAAVLVAAGPAQAGQVILVKGDHAVRVNDPTVPSKWKVALGPPMGGKAPLGVASARARGSARRRADRRAVYRALVKNRRRGKISRREYKRWRRWYVRSIRTYKRLRGARRKQLGYVIDALEELAMSRRLGATRMPSAFVQLERNRRYWRSLPYPASGDQVSFSGSEILYQYYPGEGLQLQPLSTFKKANLMYGECQRGEPTCDRDGLRNLLDEMTDLAVQRSRKFIAWEYSFEFGGGSPPWMSGMAQATGIQALGRAAQLLGDPSYLDTARAALTSSTRSRRACTSSTPSSSR